jgi:hypothetical protein
VVVGVGSVGNPTRDGHTEHRKPNKQNDHV